MTKSQVKTAASSTIAFLAALVAAITPQIELFPPKVRPYITGAGLILTALGLRAAAYNQSLSSEHISVPKEVAKEEGLIDRKGNLTFTDEAKKP